MSIGRRVEGVRHVRVSREGRRGSVYRGQCHHHDDGRHIEYSASAAARFVHTHRALPVVGKCHRRRGAILGGCPVLVDEKDVVQQSADSVDGIRPMHLRDDAPWTRSGQGTAPDTALREREYVRSEAIRMLMDSMAGGRAPVISV